MYNYNLYFILIACFIFHCNLSLLLLQLKTILFFMYYFVSLKTYACFRLHNDYYISRQLFVQKDIFVDFLVKIIRSNRIIFTRYRNNTEKDLKDLK